MGVGLPLTIPAAIADTSLEPPTGDVFLEQYFSMFNDEEWIPEDVGKYRDLIASRPIQIKQQKLPLSQSSYQDYRITPDEVDFLQFDIFQSLEILGMFQLIGIFRVLISFQTPGIEKTWRMIRRLCSVKLVYLNFSVRIERPSIVCPFAAPFHPALHLSGQPLFFFIVFKSISQLVRRLAIDTVAAQSITGPGYPHQSTAWALAATAGATSHLHVDAAGFCTWIKILKGVKFWWVAMEPEGQVCMTFFNKKVTDIDITEFRWKCFVLEAGDLL